MIRSHFAIAALLCLALFTRLPAAHGLTGTQRYDFGIEPSPYVSEVGWLSDYHSPLAGTVADTPVFIFEGDEPGGTLFILGGTHMGEPASRMAAILLAERVRVQKGRVIVVPFGNALAVNPDRDRLTFETSGGERSFYHGGRRSLLRFYEEEDPEKYTGPSGHERRGRERRNLNRVFPGVEDGTPTEQIGYAITKLIQDEKADVAFDLHETSYHPGPIAWTLASLPEWEPLLETAVEAINEVIQLDLMMPRATDTGPGLSRIEWPASTGTRAFLTETVYAGATPMGVRVGIQHECVRAVVEAYNDQAEAEARIRFDGLPTYDELAEHGLGHFLQPARE